MTTPLKPRILVADDHPIVLRGLRITNDGIAEMLIISKKTVERDRVELTRYAIRHGLVEA